MGKYCVLSVNIGEKYTNMLGNLVKTHEDYAKRWDYGYKLVSEKPVDDYHLSFVRFDGVLKCFDEGYEWVLYIDADAIVNNPSISLDHYTDVPDDLIIMREIELREHCGLFGVLNTGVFIVRNSPFSRQLFQDLIRIGKECPDKSLTDQDILNQVVHSNPWLIQCIHVLPWDMKHSINGLMSFKAKTFHRDDFIIHFISCVNNRPELIEKYMDILANEPKEHTMEFEDGQYGMYWKDVVDMEPVGADWPLHRFIGGSEPCK